MLLACCRYILILLCISVTGCATTYTSKGASQLPAQQLGTLEHPDPVHGGIVIERVDGQWRGVGLITSYRLTPGRHSLGVRVNRAFSASGRVVRWFDVKPGGRYLIEAATDTAAKRWGFWIIDKETGQRVDREQAEATL